MIVYMCKTNVKADNDGYQIATICAKITHLYPFDINLHFIDLYQPLTQVFA